MDKKSPISHVLLGLVLALGIIGLLSNSSITGNAISTFDVGLCLNNPPIANNSCPSSIDENVILNCTIGYDPDNDSLSYSLSFSPSTLFTVSGQGQVYEVLDGFDIGEYDYNVTVYDDSGCSNNNAFAQYSITVNNVGNHPPYLVQNIPNQNLIQGSSREAFILDGTYFDDIDGDELKYNYSFSIDTIETNNPNMEIFIESSTLVVIIPNNNFVGSEYVWFTAYDPSNLSAQSNVVKITVEPKEEEKEDEDAQSGRTSSAPPGGGSTPMLGGASELNCFPEWECGDWSKCYPQGIQIRECTDTEGCNISLYKPNTTQACNYTPTCFDKIKNGFEEGVDCGGNCPNECKKDDENKELAKPDKEDCEGEGCEVEAHEESPAEIDTELLIKIGVAIAILLAAISLIYANIKYKREIRRTIKRIVKKMKRSNVPLAKEESPIELLDKLEIKLGDTKNEIALARLSAIIKMHIGSLLDLKESITNEDLIKLLPDLKIDKEITSNFRNLLKELNEFEYSMASRLSKVSIQARIYEARNMFLMTSQNTNQVNYNKIIEIEEKDKRDGIFPMIIDIHLDMMNQNIQKAKDTYTQLHDRIYKEKIKDKDVISSVIRAHNLLRYYDEKK